LASYADIPRWVCARGVGWDHVSILKINGRALVYTVCYFKGARQELKDLEKTLASKDCASAATQAVSIEWATFKRSSGQVLRLPSASIK